MLSDDEIARRSLDLQNRARDVPLMSIPGYMEWSERQLAEGVCPALIANLDARAMWLLPEDIGSISTDHFEELLADLEDEISKRDSDPEKRNP